MADFILEFQDCLGVLEGEFGLFVGGAAQDLLSHRQDGKGEQLNQVAQEKQKVEGVRIISKSAEPQAGQGHPAKHPHDEDIESPHRSEFLGGEYRQPTIESNAVLLGLSRAQFRSLPDPGMWHVYFFHGSAAPDCSLKLHRPKATWPMSTKMPNAPRKKRGAKQPRRGRRRDRSQKDRRIGFDRANPTGGHLEE